MMAFESIMFRPVKVEPDLRNRLSRSCAAELRIVNLLDVCVVKTFPIVVHPLDCTLLSSAPARKTQGRRSQLRALMASRRQ